MTKKIDMNAAVHLAQAGLNKFSAGTPEHIICSAMIQSASAGPEKQSTVLQEELAALKKQVADLEATEAKLTQENTDLRKSCEDLKTENGVYESENVDLRQKISELSGEKE
jgi:septal ring factor EnvC (AmiA/AmiB activator)